MMNGIQRSLHADAADFKCLHGHAIDDTALPVLSNGVGPGSSHAQHTGGSIARTMLFDVASGQACVRSYGQKDIIF